MGSNHPGKFFAFWITFGLFLSLEFVVRFLPMHYGSGAGIFLTEHRRILAEASEPEYDYIILGDSRSLSLKGHPWSSEEPYSIYNFSLPAMSPRYFKYFLKKYLKNRNQKPAAVIFAGDPGLFQDLWNRPLHDPEKRYTDSLNEPLTKFIWNRFYRRIISVFAFNEPVKFQGKFSEEMIWDVFSHRYLHLFSPGELFEQYQGAERIFVLRESLPLWYHSFKYRDALSYYILGFKWSHFIEKPLDPSCTTCNDLTRLSCMPHLSRLQDNKNIEKTLAINYGGFNLADRLEPIQKLQYMSIRENQIKEQVNSYQTAKVNLSSLVDLIEEAEHHGIPIVLSEAPSIEAYRDTKFHDEYFKKIHDLQSRYQNLKVIRFPESYYPKDLYVEQVHYECHGAIKLNNDFYASVVPRILKFAPPNNRR